METANAWSLVSLDNVIQQHVLGYEIPLSPLEEQHRRGHLQLIHSLSTTKSRNGG